MTGTDWAALLGAIVPILALIGAAFAWLINMIVKQSKEAVTELRKSNERTQAKIEDERDRAKEERDLWRSRAFEAGWKEGSR